ncbi:uncharacterized protein LOC34618610 [Cyclospora cayetanensis]|uniref:protein-tyrosine-phosphatase n=1 Tax=Cyclospora cayetanensis TaxID=88456 RepID=A0A6P6RQT6_9EIME|nr:uncharacterized protein LOC34618610 [Cyclospora cayetanensis]
MSAATGACSLKPLDADRFPWLFWGDKKAARDEHLLRRLKISYIINCTPPCGEGGVPNFHEKRCIGSRLLFRYLRVPVYDTQTESLHPYFEDVWEFLETCRTREDGNVLVHCNQGVSRSVAFICSYLIKFEGMSAAEALAFVRRKNPLACPNEAFREQLVSLYERVKKEARGGLAEPRHLQHAPQGVWVPPCASARKRVAASSSLSNSRRQQQPKPKRMIGPARAPASGAAARAPPTESVCFAPEEANAVRPSDGEISTVLDAAEAPTSHGERGYGRNAVCASRETGAVEIGGGGLKLGKEANKGHLAREKDSDEDWGADTGCSDTCWRADLALAVPAGGEEASEEASTSSSLAANPPPATPCMRTASCGGAESRAPVEAKHHDLLLDATANSEGCKDACQQQRRLLACEQAEKKSSCSTFCSASARMQNCKEEDAAMPISAIHVYAFLSVPLYKAKGA